MLMLLLERSKSLRCSLQMLSGTKVSLLTASSSSSRTNSFCCVRDSDVLKAYSSQLEHCFNKLSQGIECVEEEPQSSCPLIQYCSRFATTARTLNG